MKASEIYLKLLRWGIFVVLFVPLVIFSQYISPFHFGKMIVFRSLIEILAVIYILLIVANKKYLPRWTPTVIAFTIFFGLYVLTSFTAVDFNYAFWGTLERMGGLFSFLHFWVFFIIIVSVFREQKDWEKLLKISVFVGFLSILFAYGQRFIQGSFFIGWQHGERLIGTIGNPALFAGYLLFILFLSIYFLIRDKRFLQKIFYAVVFILGASVLHMTVVRGSIIAFWGALFLLGLFYLVCPASLAGGLKNKKIKILIFIIIFIFVFLAGFIWLNKNHVWVTKINWLNRITGISLEEFTAQTRLWSWYSGLLGWKERPILGWGPENFVLAHAKYFNPGHFTGSGAETIWDRAHNMVLEALTTMGVIGLLSYLSIFVVIYYFLIKRFFKDKKIVLADIGIFGSLIAAYFVHNLFIFDTTANYLLFFLVLGYINFMSFRNENSPSVALTKEGKERNLNPLLIVILIVLVSILIFKTNIEPAKANYASTRAILAGRAGNGQLAFNKYQQALSFKSPQGKYEIRNKLAAFIIQYMEIQRKKNAKINPEVFDYTINELKKNVKDHPMDYITYLYLARFYIFQISENPEFGEQAEEAVLSALALNDKNPRVWYELGQVKLSEKKIDEAVMAFKKALELNPQTIESHWFLGMIYAQAGNMQEAVKYVEQAINMGYNYRASASDFNRLINLYEKVGDYYKIIDYYKAAIELEPGNAQFYVSLAVVYKKIGDKENAILYAQEAASLDPENFEKQSEEFINSLE